MNAMEQQSTPVALKISSNRSFSIHKADDLDKFLYRELKGPAVVQVVKVDAFLAFANLEFWGEPQWNRMFETLKNNTTQVGLRESWLATRNRSENKQYKPFCDWLESLIKFISNFGQPSPRPVSFLPLGSKLLSTTPGYADGDEVDGTSTSIKPDAVCVLQKEADGFSSWSQVLIPIELKKKPGSTLNASSSHAGSSSSAQHLSASTSAKGSDAPAKKPKQPYIPHRIPSNAPPNTARQKSSSPTTYTPSSTDIQLARYAMETLAAVGDRTHVFGLVVKCPHITLWYFDRCGAVRSPTLNVQDAQGQDFLAFVKFLSALVYMEDDTLGFNPFFGLSTGTKRIDMRKDLRNISIKTSELGEASLKLEQPLDRRTGLVGRATVVYKAKLWRQGEGNGVSVDAVLKSSWQHVQRTSEYDILQTLLKDPKASQHVVEVFYKMEGPTVSSQRGRFGEPKPKVVDDRTLRYTVAEYLSPITKLSQPFHIPHIGWSVLQAIKFLNRAGWYHRDISVGNIGFKLDSDCQGVIVKLLDFDLSKEIGSKSKGPHWTGTLPFMSIEILENPEVVHKVGFEVEALIWVLLWIVQVYVEGKEEYGDKEHPLIDWFSNGGKPKNIAAIKHFYLRQLDPFTNDYYQELEPQMRSLSEKWYAMREDLLKMRVEAKDNKLLSDHIYGDEGLQEIETWMIGDQRWDLPKKYCTCGAHCAFD
ncbi:hypothetical protein FS837_012743 [Tulasnella sp. UAMH 9824]|nr:hypothetical protein FS837_012743 [Tulasnella sp. UAMH 9824]